MANEKETDQEERERRSRDKAGQKKEKETSVGKDDQKAKPSPNKKSTPADKIDPDVQKLSELEKHRVQSERKVERLKEKQNQLRSSGNGLGAGTLEPELRLAHMEHLDLIPVQQKHRNKVKDKIQHLCNSRQTDKAKKMHQDLAKEYRKLHLWATTSHRLTKSPVFSKARHDFHLKAQQHDQHAIDPDRVTR